MIALHCAFFAIKRDDRGREGDSRFVAFPANRRYLIINTAIASIKLDCIAASSWKNLYDAYMRRPRVPNFIVAGEASSFLFSMCSFLDNDRHFYRITRMRKGRDTPETHYPANLPLRKFKAVVDGIPGQSRRNSPI